MSDFGMRRRTLDSGAHSEARAACCARLARVVWPHGRLPLLPRTD